MNLNQSFYRFLPGFHEFIIGRSLKNLIAQSQEGSRNDRFDLIISVDVAQLTQLGEVYAEYARFFENNSLINFDHHSSNTMFGKVNIIGGDAVSTTEVLFDVFRELNYTFEEDVATCLLTGIIADTSRFTTANVNAKTFQKAGLLLKAGADLTSINNNLKPSESVEKARVMASVVSKIQSSHGEQIVWVSVNRDMVNEIRATRPIEKLTSNLASYLRALRGVKVSVVFYERSDGSVKVSLRGRPNIDVLSVASEFGGGGHLEAAGCVLNNIKVQDAEKLILRQVRKLTLN